MKTAQELQALAQFTQELVKRGYSKDQLKTALARQGSNLAEVASVMQYGAGKVAEARTMSEQFVEPSKMGEQEYWENRLSSLSNEEKAKMKQDPEYAKRWIEANERKSPVVEAIKSAPRAMLESAVGRANALTLGGLSWLDEKIGSPANVKGVVQKEKEMFDEMGGVLGGIGKAAAFTGDIASSMASPVAKVIPVASGNYFNWMPKSWIGRRALGAANLAGDVALGAVGGSLYGGISSGFQSDFDKEAMKRGAMIGGALGGSFPVANKVIQTGISAAKAPINVASKYVPNVLRRWGFSPTQEQISGEISTKFGRPDVETVGYAVREAGLGLEAQLKAQQRALYDKANQLAGNPQIKMTKKGSELGKAISEISQNTTKSGKKELTRIWGEIGHTGNNAPNYLTLKTLKSSLSDKSANATGTLTKSQWKTLQNAVEKDIERGVGSKAYKALKEADSFYAKQLNDPNSIASSLDKLLRGSDSVVGNRAVKSATGQAWKASELNKVIEKAEPLGLAEPIKQAIRPNITTRAQFNRMTPAQKRTIYADTLPQAEQTFRSDLATILEDALSGVGRFVDKAKNINITPLSRPAVVLTDALGGI